jgi:hypothetical protein
MSPGTFPALCINPQFFLQNLDSFDQIKGHIDGNSLTITCQNEGSADSISWMVVAERQDPTIKEWNRTNPQGFLVTEYSP